MRKSKMKMSFLGMATGMLVAAMATGAFAEGKTLVMGDTSFNTDNAENSTDPHDTYSGWACIRYGIGETLFKYTDNMEVEPWLAKSYENIDELTWKIELRDDVYFHDGCYMDGESVKACLEKLVADHDRAPGDLCIDSIEADGQTLTIKTTVPKPTLINYLSDPYGCIYDIKEGVTDGIVVGTGPFVGKEFVVDDHLTVVKNENYYGGEVKVDEVTIRSISDGDTLAMALQGGELDMAYGMAYANYPLFENDNFAFTSTPTSRAFFGWMNYESPITSDPAVRKAIAMGIDKEGFVAVLLSGYGYPATAVFPDTFSFGQQNCTTESYDPEGAMAVLEEAGWVDEDGDGIREKDGQKLTLRWLTYPSRQELPLLAESVHATLGAIGFDVQINCTSDSNSLRKEPDKWDVYAQAFVTAPTGDPEYWFTSCALDSSANNYCHFHSDELEELEKQMSVEFDPEKRGELAIKMQQAILDDNGYVFCSHLRMSMISRKGVEGLVAHPCDFYELTANLDIVE